MKSDSEAPRDIKPEILTQADAVLHPAGRCSCAGEGACDWCKMNEARGGEQALRVAPRALRRARRRETRAAPMPRPASLSR